MNKDEPGEARNKNKLPAGRYNLYSSTRVLPPPPSLKIFTNGHHMGGSIESNTVSYKEADQQNKIHRHNQWWNLSILPYSRLTFPRLNNR